MVPDSKDKIEIYLSHSWRPEDVDLNLLVWNALADDCRLSVDRQGAALKLGSFYVNRLEFLIRQSDAFVSVLPFREAERAEDAWSADYGLRCSKASLFEIRLAERARKPRLVIYDSDTRFRPSPQRSKHVRYEAVDAGREVDRDGPIIRSVVEEWLSGLRDRRDKGLMPVRNDVTILIDDQNASVQEIKAAIEAGLADSRFSELHMIRPDHLDSEIVTMLQASDLFVADVGALDSGALGVASALFVPTIRFMTAENALPTLLTGHPFGYDRDIVAVEEPVQLTDAIRERISAMAERRRLITDAESGRAYFRSKLNAPHKIFVSHNLTGDDVMAVQRIINTLDQHSIIAWEYRDQMTSGVQWREKLANAMADSTHVVFIVAEGFEQSPACFEELTFFKQHKKIEDANVFPFLWKRTKPLAAYQDLDNPPLPADPGVAADVVAHRLIAAINRT